MKSSEVKTMTNHEMNKIQQDIESLGDTMLEAWSRMSPQYWAGFELWTFRKHRAEVRERLLRRGYDADRIDRDLDADERRLEAEFEKTKKEYYRAIRPKLLIDV
jgi:hypothetical protein